MLFVTTDNKIYISRGNYYGMNSNTYFTHHLDVIEYPDSVGLGCHYIQNGFDLGSHFLAGFLPNMAYFGLGAETGSICDSLTTRVNEVVESRDGLEIFPNPSSGFFSFGLMDASDKIVSWKVKNLLGENIFSMSPHSAIGNFDISDKPAGVYFLQITTRQKKIITAKLVKE